MRFLETIAWTLGLALALLYAAARVGAEQERAAGIEAFHAASTAPASSSLTGSDPAPEESTPIDQSLWSPQRVAAYFEAAAQPGAPLGLLQIPSVDLRVPVFAGTSELNLNRGAAHIEGTAPLGPDGNVGIAAHRDGFFRALGRLSLDAALHLQTAAGTFRYRVVDIQIVTPEDVHVLEPTEVASVTLVTCYPFHFLGSAPERYIVRAELDGESPPLVSPRGVRHSATRQTRSEP